MIRALELARLGVGAVSPNPMVGCVIVHNDKIIGEGWHKQYGGPHAEVNAIDAVQDKSLLNESTAYVSLEPCSHFGKTPPCVDLLIKHQLKRVVIASTDPNPLVAGRGIKKLKEAGIEVSESVCEQEGLEINKRFFTAINKKRPFVILKWAQTADGFVARSNYDSKWISKESSRKLVHKWRSEEDAILVGYQTALNDNPQLNVRMWSGKDPVRLVIDKNNSLPQHLYLFDKTQRTIIYNLQKDEAGDQVERVKVGEENLLEDILADLYKRDIRSVIIEGGTATLNQFIAADLWDQANVFISPKTFGDGISAPVINKNIFAEEIIKDDRLLIYKNY